MRRSRKSARTLGEHDIFGNEEAAQLRSDVDELRTALTDLGQRVDAQFTTIAAHAEIAREQADFAREEARADLERTRETLIGLIEQVRNELVDPATHHVAGSAPGPSITAHTERLEAIEARLEQVVEVVETCFARQRELADTMEALIDTIFADQRGEPVAGLSLQ